MNALPPKASAAGGEESKTAEQIDFENLVDAAFRLHFAKRDQMDRIRIDHPVKRRSAA